MERHEQIRQYERGLSLNDLDLFADLEWERNSGDKGSRQARRKPSTLSAVVEDYLRTYF